MRIDLCENKITLIKIKNIICPEENDVKFLNRIFSPLAKEKMTFYESYSIEKHKSFFMNGNITRNYNKSSENYNKKQRDRTRDLKEWAKALICTTAFAEMLDIVKEITERLVFNRHHKVFNLIDIDKDIMPDDLLNFINLCLEKNECASALLMLILWSVYGEYIIYIENIYTVSKQSLYKPFQKNIHLVSHIKPCRPVFMGRDTVINDIHEYFLSGNHFVFLKGMGGIGKSECAKQYAEKYKSDYNTIVFAECTDSLINLINDNSVFTLTAPFVSERMQNESSEEFFSRKIAQIKKIADEKTLVIIDNLDFISTAEIEQLIAVPFHLIITTRYDYSSIYQQQTKFIEEIHDKLILRNIFTAYYGKNIDDFTYADKIIDKFSGHTMAVELVAKQMKSACMNPQEMFEILQKSAESEFEEKFIMPNHSKEYQTLPQHMLTLFNVSALSEGEKYILMCLALMPLSGIDKRSFKQACRLKNFNSINRLIERSWISENDNKIYLHTLIKETVKIFCKPDLLKCREFINELIQEYSAFKCYYGDYIYKEEVQRIALHIYNEFPEPELEIWKFYEWLELIFSHCNYNDISLKITEKLYKLYKSSYGENHFRTARTLVRAGCSKRKYDDFEYAVELMKKGREIIVSLKNRTPEETLYISDINLTLTNTLLTNHNLYNDTVLLDEVENLCLEAISIRRNLKEVFEPLFVNSVQLHHNLAWLEIYRNNYKKITYYLEIINKECNNMEHNYIYFLVEYIKEKLALEQGDVKKAVKHMENAVKIRVEFFGEYDMTAICARTELGDLYLKLGNNFSAHTQYKNALEHLEKMPYNNNKLRNKIIQKIKSIEN